MPVEKQSCRVGPDGSIQCWAHSKAGARCTASVLPREGEPVPIPYCGRHMAAGDGALQVRNARRAAQLRGLAVFPTNLGSLDACLFQNVDF